MKDDAGEEGFPITALRETNVLLSLQHPNIIRVREMVVGSSLDQVPTADGSPLCRADLTTLCAAWSGVYGHGLHAS